MVSGVAARTVLSTSLLFLVAGMLIGQGGFGLVSLTPDSPIIGQLADLALFTVLFVDGTGLRNLSGEGSWKQPARALGIGMPLAFGGVALLAHFVAGFDWITAMLVGAVLAPTDPVFASAIVGRTDVPARLRRLLSVESGLNDGLALPVVLILVSAAGRTGSEHTGLGVVGLELLAGLAIGVVAAARRASDPAHPRPRRRTEAPTPRPAGHRRAAVRDRPSHRRQPVPGGVRRWCRRRPTQPCCAGGVLPPRGAAGRAGQVRRPPRLRSPPHPSAVGQHRVGGWIVAVLSLVLVRPLSLILSLLGSSGLERKELYAAAWFGPKGFASVVYGLLVLHSGIPQAQQAYELVAVCIGLSIIAHSSTDVPVARLFHVEKIAGLPEDEARHPQAT